MYTLVITPYLNTRAFVHHGAPPDCRLRPLAPKQAVPAIVNGEALAAIVPVAALGAVSAHADLLGDYGIACPGAARSVLLFSRVPFEAIDGSTRVALSADSMSSVRLLFLLLGYRARDRGRPRVVAPGQAVDAELVIGDAALLRAARDEYPFSTDLAALWRQQHGLPMVFARWVIQNDAPRALRRRLLAWLDRFALSQAALYERTALLDHARAGLEVDAARRYLAGIRIALGEAELRGQQRYQQELARYPWPAELATTPAHKAVLIEV